MRLRAGLKQELRLKQRKDEVDGEGGLMVVC